MDIDLRSFGGSALTSDISDIDVPKGRNPEEMSNGIPITYVPARNTIFLSFALAWAEVLECGDIFIGVNALDYSGYPDCRPEFIEAFETLANLATKVGIEGTTRITIHAPLINLTKAQIIRKGVELGVDYSLTSSCYDPSGFGEACGSATRANFAGRDLSKLGSSIQLDIALLRRRHELCGKRDLLHAARGGCTNGTACCLLQVLRVQPLVWA